MDDIAHLLQLYLQCLDAVGLLDLQAGKTREPELHTQGTAGYHDGLSQIGRTGEIVFEFRQKTVVRLQHNIRKMIMVLKFALHSQQTEDVFHHGISLLRAVHQAFELDAGVDVAIQSHHLIPVGRSTPVVLYHIRCLLVRLWLHGDGVHIRPVGIGTIFLHRPERKVDVRAGCNLSCQLQFQSVLQNRTDHQERRDVLRTDIAHYLQVAAFQRLASDVEWGITFLLLVGDVGAQIAQGIYEDADRTVLHALGAGDGMFARGGREIGGHETHGCAGCLDVDDLWHILKGGNDYFRVIAVAQVVGLDMASSHRTDYESSVADTLGCWQVDTCVQLAWCLDGIFYHTRTLYYIYFSAKVQNKKYIR